MKKYQRLKKKLEEINPSTDVKKVLFWGKDIDLNLDERKRYVLIGPTGEGKTEILNQLAYLYKAKGQKVGYVAQSPYVFDDSLEKNLFLGSEQTEENRALALRLLKIFGLSDLEVDPKKKLFSMPLGENGKRLSGGQIKRMCLVRSLLLDNEILVWDDPFSSVDLILEKEIIHQLESLDIFKNKTLIFFFSSVGICKVF